MKGLLLGAAVLVSACDTPGKPVAPEAAARLHVVVPEGWKQAVGTDGLLQVGPEGRVVLQIESTGNPLPELESLLAALEADEVNVVQKESESDFVGARYTLGADAVKQGFLGVRQAGPRVVWCATTASAKPEEVEAALTVCRTVSWEGGT